MRLKLLLPSQILIDEPVRKIIAEAGNGSFCLEPRHVDFVAALVPGLLMYVPETGGEVFIAVDEGILVKCGAEVLISTPNAVRGDDLATLRETVEERFKQQDEAERLTRSALARLEAGVLRRFTQMQE
ncbi:MULTISPECIES: F0F1 ATP synthase subunit epsilon [Methylobacter]|uniref:F0F1 ATP synthase subunit epsilon n=1 Tax=Methylobacter TaxID=429 RepID=UPI00037FC478|nr:MULTISPECIES: F0F1 ATP synthase subunit epsilon [Methylobacter]